MSCTKTTGADVYSVRKNHEWATIVVREWADTEVDGKQRQRGEILINSSFGAWSQFWGAPGCRFKKFLLQISMDYAFGRFMQRDQLDEYDGDATVRSLRKRVVLARKERRISKVTAAWLRDQIDDEVERMERNADGFIEACGSILHEADQCWSPAEVRRDIDDLRDQLDEAWYRTETRTNPQAVGFWRELWPEFTQALRAEVAADALPAAA